MINDGRDPGIGSHECREAENLVELPTPVPVAVLPANVAHLELVVSYVLRLGVLVSLAVTLVGLVLLFLADPANAVVRTGGPPVRHDLARVLADLLQLRPKAIIDLGLILLILTPIVRVGVTVVAFILDNDWTYVAITLFVLAILIASFFLGRVE